MSPPFPDHPQLCPHVPPSPVSPPSCPHLAEDSVEEGRVGLGGSGVGVPVSLLATLLATVPGLGDKALAASRGGAAGFGGFGGFLTHLPPTLPLAGGLRVLGGPLVPAGAWHGWAGSGTPRRPSPKEVTGKSSYPPAPPRAPGQSQLVLISGRKWPPATSHCHPPWPLSPSVASRLGRATGHRPPATGWVPRECPRAPLCVPALALAHVPSTATPQPPARPQY